MAWLLVLVEEDILIQHGKVRLHESDRGIGGRVELEGRGRQHHAPRLKRTRLLSVTAGGAGDDAAGDDAGAARANRNVVFLHYIRNGAVRARLHNAERCI